MPDWTALPSGVRRYLVKRLLDQALAIHGGWPGIVTWLYRGTKRPDGTRLSYSASASDLYQYVIADHERDAGGAATAPTSSQGSTVVVRAESAVSAEDPSPRNDLPSPPAPTVVPE